MQLRKMVLGLGLATLTFAFAPALGAEPAAGPSGEVMAPATPLADCATPSLPEILAEPQVCDDSELPSAEQDLLGVPSPNRLCSGDNCGCYEEFCPDECADAPTPLHYQHCVRACIRAQVNCAISCCGGF